jgi:cytochrome c peroxidase
MRLRSSSYFALSAVACACAGAFVIACSSDDGLISPAPSADAGPLLDGALPDREVADSSTTDPADAGHLIFTTEEIAAMKTMSPLPSVPADPTNAFADNPAAAVLGQRLFFDKSFSGALAIGDPLTTGSTGAVGQAGTLSCFSCHSSKAMDDDRSKPNNVSLGTDYGTRNALSIVNSSFYKWTNWGGRFDSQWSLPLAVAENGKIMKSSRLQIAHMLYAKYKTDYDAIFPVPLDAALDPAAADAARFPATGRPKAAADADGPWELMTQPDRDIVMRIYANFGKAIAAYMRRLVSRNAAFDRLVTVVASDQTGGNTVGEDAKRGARVFLGKGKCSACHSGPNFSDDQFHNIGVEQTGPNVPAIDNGRLTDIPQLLGSPFNTNGAYSDSTTTGKLTGVVASPANQGQFRTKSLRGLPASAPFMHSGQLATLDDVVKFYSAGGGSAGDGGVKDPKMTAIGLSTGEAADLVAFLKTLGGEDVPAALLMDTSK